MDPQRLLPCALPQTSTSDMTPCPPRVHPGPLARRISNFALLSAHGCSSKRKEKKLGECAGQPASRSERTPSPESSTAPMIITTTDIGRPVLVKGYGPGLLMYWGLYPKTGRPRAGVAFNRPIGLNNGTIEVGGAGQGCVFCIPASIGRRRRCVSPHLLASKNRRLTEPRLTLLLSLCPRPIVDSSFPVFPPRIPALCRAYSTSGARSTTGSWWTR